MAKLASELTVAEVLGDDGIIQHHIAGFQTRPSQLGMAELIHQSINERKSYVIEASTGIGKSFAYLVPAFLSNTKTLISTGTKNLQDQLFKKDLPLINKMIVSGKKLALLKGRSNYCCPYRIQKFRQQRQFQSRQLTPLFDALSSWSETSITGDIAEFPDIPENDSLWFYATANADNCLGNNCSEFSRCFVMKARRKAQEADIIVINHHLFFSDQAIKEEGFGELLPDVDVLIFDEAHQLPDVASHFFGRSITMRQFELLTKDIVAAQLIEARDSKDIQGLCHENQKAIADFRLILDKFASRGEWRNIQHAPAIKEGIKVWSEALQGLVEYLEKIKSRGKELAVCFGRLDEFQNNLNDFLSPSSDDVTWYEWNERSFRLMLSPVEIAQQFKKQLSRNPYHSIFFTSATLSSNHSFDYFTHRLGIHELQCVNFDSPFDYQKQALLYLPEDLPEPNDDRFVEAFIHQCCELINATKGNCFILFTSYRMLTITARELSRKIKNKLFVQGEMQRSELLKSYLKTPNPVLLGTSSFWEGVDVKGDKLKLVIIDKLPFKSPADPVYKRRLQRISEQGGNPFNDVQIPEATISLRQGVGRLIRDIHDKGIVMIADNRLQTKSYAAGIIKSLPDMQQTRQLKDAMDFAKGMRKK